MAGGVTTLNSHLDTRNERLNFMIVNIIRQFSVLHVCMYANLHRLIVMI